MKERKIWVRYVGTLKSICQSWLGHKFLFQKDKVYPEPVSQDFFNHLISNIPENFEAAPGPDIIEKPVVEIIQTISESQPVMENNDEEVEEEVEEEIVDNGETKKIKRRRKYRRNKNK